MAIRDYATKSNKSSRRRKKSKSQSPSKSKKSAFVVNFNPMLLLVLVVGALFGGSVFYVEYFRDLLSKFTQIGQKQLETVKASKVDDKLVVAKAAPAPTVSNTPKFEFYRTLPKMQVATDRSVAKTTAKNYEQASATLTDKIEKGVELALKSPTTASATINPPVNPPADAASANSVYVLQLASFKEMKEAEQLKAKLTLGGFDVIIQSAKLANGDVWYRVKTNPLKDIALANNINNRLKQHNIKGILLTEKLTG